MSKHILFLTGRLAEQRLQKVLVDMSPAFTYEVRNIGVNVAALMTTDMILRRLQDTVGIDQIILPGLCRGNLDQLSEALSVPVARGPVDVKDLPEFFGLTGKPIDLNQYNTQIFAEITDAPNCSTVEIMAQAKAYQKWGADVIDIGCLPDTPFAHMEEAIGALHDEGFLVSVDSLKEDELLRAGHAGADYLLSLKNSTLWIIEEVSSIPIIIPEHHKDMPSLYRAIDTLMTQGRVFYADSILDPIHFGFTESILRYHALRERYPDIAIMVGIGNLTELTEADTSGINAILFGIISELEVTAILSTQVSPHCRSAICEADWARRIMFAAKNEKRFPKGLHDALTTIHHRRPFIDSPKEIEAIAKAVRDPSYRIQISEQGIHVYNREGIWCEVDPYALFSDLESTLREDASHAFYMGVELAKAQIAWQLGRRYIQDEELSWGAASQTKNKIVGAKTHR